jgi:ABC-2 type transport system permease protein
LLAAAFLLLTSTLLLYSMWILTVSAAFYVVKVDNLSYLFSAIFDAARWPSTIFRGTLSFFTFVIPLALMTTYPALAMLGRLTPSTLLLAFAGSMLFALLARLIWLRSIGKYTSASS